MIRCLSIFFVSDGAGNEVINPESEKKIFSYFFLPLKETKCGLLSNSLLAHAKYNTICSHK